MSGHNPFLALMEDDDAPKATKKQPAPAASVEPSIIAPEKSPMSGIRPDLQPDADLEQAPSDSFQTFLDLMGEDDGRTARTAKESIPGIGLGELGSAVSSNAPTIAEIMAGAPAGSVQAAQKAAGPKGSGQSWLKNWANIEKPEFTGGVPEAAQAYQRGKPQGKVTSKLYKKFGDRSLNIGGFTAEQALIDAKNAEAAREAQAIKNAQGATGALKTVGKLAGVAGAGLGVYDVYQRLKDRDVHGAIASGIGTAASLAPLAIGSAGVLPAIGIAAPLYLMAHERQKRLLEHPEEFRLDENEFDPMGNRQR
jgi:hypothetical protein